MNGKSKSTRNIIWKFGGYIGSHRVSHVLARLLTNIAVPEFFLYTYGQGASRGSKGGMKVGRAYVLYPTFL